MVLDQAYIFRSKITHQRLTSIHDQANNRSQNEKKRKEMKNKTKQTNVTSVGSIKEGGQSRSSFLRFEAK